MGRPTSRIEAAFADGPALIPYLTAGDPDAESTIEYVRALERGGADVIELGLPFSEPIADGPTIQDAIARSLSGGMTPDRFFDLVSEVSGSVDVPLVVMTYYNLIYQYGDDEGVEPFVEAAADVGLSGLIVPDLPVEESAELRDAGEYVAITVALDFESRLAKRFDVLPDCRPRDPEIVRHRGAGDGPVGERVEDPASSILHTTQYWRR